LSIIIKNLTKKFEDQIILDNLSFQVEKGEIVCITGSSGCGKTTLLRLISGLDSDFKAEKFKVDGLISYLFQENRLLPWKDVMANISFVVDDVLDDKEKQNKIKYLLKATYLSTDAHKYPNELSGGMQRRVALCRSFIYPSDILIMDEPFSGLDMSMKEKIADNFISMIDKDKIVLIVTHDESIMKKCNRIIKI